MAKKYVIEFYYPYNTKDIAVSYESDQPYMNINIGDVIYETPNENFLSTGMYKNGQDLVVCGVSHFLLFSEDDGHVHKKMIFTKHVLSTENTKKMFE